ncbi:MAG: SagB/ThcOx family dehydrogenase [Chromatiales bacterium]
MDNHVDTHDARPAEVALAYHQRTKHHFGRYARSLGYLDWDTQPDPFRRYPGATRIPLAHPPVVERPTYDELLRGDWGEPSTVDHGTLSQFFYESLAISAWKQLGSGPPWSLRINPSSGDLHPTEAYLIAGPICGIGEQPAVYHYCVHDHALERRLTLEEAPWSALASRLPRDAFLVALTSIHWRESWKYGERAYRYCHHDAGHAIAAIALCTAVLGWQSRLVDGVPDESLQELLGLTTQQGPEREHADSLLAVIPAAERVPGWPRLELPASFFASLRRASWEGEPNRLSREHNAWAVIDEVSVACRYHGSPMESRAVTDLSAMPPAMRERYVPARVLIRRRRSAVDMDGVTALPREAFYRLLAEIDPDRTAFPFNVLPWQPQVSLALFVHRVEGLSPGLYLLSRDRRHETDLRQQLRPEFLWQSPGGCPPYLALHLLVAGDARAAARTVSCHQDVAADGAFSAGMLARFDGTLRESGAWMYPRLFWETGVIGQMLYLGAEAAGVRATGIGCFFDDAMHELLGITDQRWQSLYHFTVGGAVDDARLTTLPPYWHLGKRE